MIIRLVWLLVQECSVIVEFLNRHSGGQCSNSNCLVHHYFYHPVTFFAVTKVIDQPVELSGKPLQDYINGKNLTVNRATNKIIETWIRIPVIISPIPLSINDLSHWTPFDLICSNENLKWITLVMCKIFGIQYLTYLYTSKYGAPINNDLDFCCSQRYWYM